MKSEEIERLRLLCEKATPGPACWTSERDLLLDGGDRFPVVLFVRNSYGGQVPLADKERLSESYTALPALLAEIDRLRARVAELEQEYVADVDRLTQETWAALRSRDEARADLAGLAECRERVAAVEWEDRSDWSGCGIDGIYMTAYDDGRWYASSIGSGDAPDLTAAKAAASECAARLLWAMEVGR